jgi:hypothetical protein
MEFINFLLIAILVLYIIRSLARILLPMLFQKVVNNAQQHQQQSSRSQSTKEGKIRVDYIPQTKKSSIPDSEGDFVDYEEIK